MGTGKQSALKQSSDGSFELVVEDEPELEPSHSSSEPQPSPAGPSEASDGPSILKWAVLAAVVVALGGIVALVAFGGPSSDGEGAENGTSSSSGGFKPYVGDEGAAVPVDTVRPSQPARRQVDDEPEPETEPPEAEMVEEVVDERWQLDETGEEIVESEEIPPDFIDQVEEGDEEIEPARDGTRFVNPSTLKDIRKRIQQDIEIKKSLPNLNLEAAPRIRPQRINLENRVGNATGPDPDDITVIDGETGEEIPLDDVPEDDE